MEKLSYDEWLRRAALLFPAMSAQQRERWVLVRMHCDTLEQHVQRLEPGDELSIVGYYIK